MMSSICLAKTAVSFGAAASAMRGQPVNGATAEPASNRRLVNSVMVGSPCWFAVGCSMPYACHMPRYHGDVQNAPVPMHQSNSIDQIVVWARALQADHVPPSAFA